MWARGGGFFHQGPYGWCSQAVETAPTTTGVLIPAPAAQACGGQGRDGVALEGCSRVGGAQGTGCGWGALAWEGWSWSGLAG